MEHPVTSEVAMVDNRWPINPHVIPSAKLNQRGELARKLLEVSLIAPKYNGPDKPAELVDVETLVTRAFNAADLFFQEAHFRECLVRLPSYEDVERANETERTRAIERKRAEAAKAA